MSDAWEDFEAETETRSGVKKRARTSAIKAKVLERVLSKDKRLNAAFDRADVADIADTPPEARFTSPVRKHGRPHGGKVVFGQSRIDALPEFGCIARFAKILNVRRASIQQWCHRKKNPLPCVPHDRQMILRKDVLVKWLIGTGRYKPKPEYAKAS